MVYLIFKIFYTYIAYNNSVFVVRIKINFRREFECSIDAGGSIILRWRVGEMENVVVMCK
ncbi:hypothetical protein JL193_00455 [Polaribacter batillariae]|uniref:Uncharacterized protein n=1 Tax=Polaribacter batillariae TaxID=2808900 RepID=A0ABX7SWX3_9FLAO|nr:hypothetical protein [Polaribacter batillariae]QTD37818.1 hypothetical protein JL193_00455 [Polaribacter batillariae]